MKKIIIVKQGGIGDVILVTSVIAELKRIFFDSYITLMIKKNAIDIIKGLDFIDDVFVYDKQNCSVYRLWKKMRGYDISIHLDLTYRPAMIAALAGIPIRIGIEHKRKIWLNKPVKWEEYMDHVYEPYVMGDIVNKWLSVKLNKNKLNKPYITAAMNDEYNILEKFLFNNGINKGKRYVVSSPITAYFLKNWPLNKWNELYSRLYNKYGIKTVIFGCGDLKYNWNKDAVIDLFNKLNLRQVGALIKDAELLVNSCSMPIHMAAAVNTKCVVLYGYGDPNRWAPRFNCSTVVTKLKCSPCDGYVGSKCTNPLCMKNMTVEEVFKTCETMLDKG